VSGWREMTLREAGVSLIDCDHRTPPPSESGYSYVAIPQLKQGRLDLSDARRISREYFVEWTRKANPQPNGGHRRPDKHIVNWQRFVTWRTTSVTLLTQVLPQEHAHRKAVDGFAQISNEKSKLEWGISFLKGIEDDFKNGFLGSLSAVIEAEVAADYMGQAEHLLAEGQTGKFDHVPAAVLCGAVLEKALRTLCGEQQPPISTATSGGEPKTLNPLIDDLKKAGVFNEAKAKQLRAWAAIRNHAAHGQFDQFNRKDVEQMIQGINNFLADYLK